MSAKPLYKKAALTAILYLTTLLATAQLVANFGATPISGCAPLVVNFHDSSTGSPVYWKWDLGNGTISFLQNPSGTYFNPGPYTVKLTVKNAAGVEVTTTKTNFINVFPLPNVNFTGTPVTGCFPLLVNFTDNSTAGSGTITARLWDFGDGNSSILQNPNHIYTSAGTFNVTLTITNSNGCSKTITKQNYISISTGVNAAFTNSTPSGCSAPETITFQNQSTGTGVLSYLWNFGDGNTSTLQNPTHSFTTVGSFNVSLIVTNSTGCTDTVIHNNAVVIGAVHANFTLPSSVCVGTAITITNTSSPTPTAAAWNFGDGTTSTAINPVKTYSTAGIKTIQLISTFGGCTDIITHDINVLPKPTAAFVGFPQTSCSAPLTVNFTSNSIGAVSYQWYFGDGGTSTNPNPTHTYTALGAYTDTLIVTNANGCTDTLVKNNYIKIQPPIASINNLPQQGCAPLAWTFSSTINSVDPVVSYQWFSNGVLFSNASNPSHIFPVGNYNIQLVVTTAGGCTDTVRVPNGIKAALKPTPLFSATPTISCAFSPITFQDQSTGTIDEWHWLFGDGNTSNEQNPTHAYEDTGFFTVTLIVGNNGCRDTLKLVDFIYIKPPIAAFTIGSNCNDHFKRTFTDNSIGADTYDWTFGDGGFSSIPNPTHIYTAVGTYNVKLKVHNNQTGCDHEITKQVIIADEFAAFNASLLQLCKNSSTTFTATSPHTPPAIANYEWDFGDGTTGTGNPISHVYLDANNYTVKLKITDINGCTDELTKPSYISVFGPTANFTPSVPGSCLLSAITFTDLSTTDGIHPITEWKWEYGDGIIETLTAPPFTHAYSGAGLYTVSLTVKDSYGCSITKVKTDLLTISQPTADFATPNSPSCPNSPVVFTNSSTGPGLTYLWNFGDNQTSTAATPTHLYAADGNYTVTLTITDIYGCTDVEVKPDYIQIHSPVADFSVNNTTTTCPPLNAQFTNTSQYANSYLWVFGDGGTSININPSHIYNTAGTYTATLTVTSPGGCTAVKTQQMIVRGPRGSFTYSPLTGCSPLVVNFVGTTPDVVSFIWDYNDGNTEATSNALPNHPYTIPGIYVPKMILVDAAGCTVPITGTDTIRVNGVTANFTPDTLIRCSNGSVVFTNLSTSNDVITGYLWNFGDGNTSTDPSPTHYYAGEGLFFPKLKVTTQTGCVDDSIYAVPVRVVKTPDVSITTPINKCVPASISFQGNLLNGDTSAISWNWTLGNGTNVTGQNISSQTFTTAGIYADTLYVVNSSGCRDTAFTTHEVYPKPTINAGTDITICKGTGQTLTASGGSTYTWSPALGLSATAGTSVLATPDSLTNYTVTGTSAFGCVNTDVVQVAVKYPFQIPDGTNATLCVGKSTTLNTSGNYTFSWSPSAGLNTTTGTTVTATPSTTTNYMVVASDDKNCFTDTAHFLVNVYPIPTVTAGTNKTINVGQSVTLTPTVSADVNSVVWSPSTWVVSSNTPSITVKPNLDMQYKVSVSNAGGCTASSLVNVYVLCDGANVFIPNTFSPNGDGANDYFFPRGTGLFTIKQLRIFNRWGEQVFEKYSFKANDESAGWDGTFKGQKLPNEVYVYVMDIQCQNNSVLSYKGNIALIR